ncbi:MAG: NUDIX hydrolase [Acidimicrobiia bacterium]
MTPQVAVGAVVVHDGALLVIERANEPEAGRWSVPGVTPAPAMRRTGASLWEAVAREVREETGVEVAVDRMLGWVERIGKCAPGTAEPEYHYVILDFAATPLDPEPVPVAGDDARQAAWVALEELASLDLAEGLAEFLAEVGVLSPARPFGL